MRQSSYLWSTALVACLVGCAPDGGDRPPAVAGDSCQAGLERPSGMLVAGSGAALALARRLARRWERATPGARVRVPESIGTSGATRALLDGSIDVGLASRELTEEERRAGLVATPLARSLVAFVANKEVRTAAVEQDDLVAAYDGLVTAWPDGTPLVPVVREPGDSGSLVIRAHLPKVWEAMERARVSGRGVVCRTDQEARDALLTIEGAVGPLDVGIVRLEGLPLRPLTLGGVVPDPSEALAGRYPLVRTVWLVTRGRPAGPIAGFVEAATSKEVADELAAGGYLRP